MASAGARATSHLMVFSLGSMSSEDLLRLHAWCPDRYPVLLESAANSLHGRNHDVLLAFPGERLECRAGQDNGSAFLSALDDWWRRERVPATPTPHGLPFGGGWFVYLAYELAQQIELSLQLPVNPGALIAQAVRMPAAIQRCCETGEAWFVAESGSAAESWLAQLQQDRQQAQLPPCDLTATNMHEDAPECFTQAVAAALQHIAAGNIYQANLSRGWQGQATPGGAPTLYQRLRRSNPAPFAGLAQLAAGHYLISSSPERLVEVRDGWANTRPIAGTRPRDANAIVDQQLVRELMAHPKERAEHIMLLDLERNDLGRVCEGGSVEVNEYMTIESYAHVHHIVSNVRGRLRAGVTPGAVIAALFPGGTITGVPKVRCMQIIADLERTARGAYTGSMGYLNRDGSMDLNILIRTLELEGGQLRFRAGAGIVADSIATRELEETRAKALGLLRALQVEP